MAKLRTIDTHTHILTQETAALLTKAGVKVSITPDNAEWAALDVAGVVYRPFPTGGFDIARRLRDMDATGVDVHVLSVTPQTYLYNQEPELGAVLAAIQNDQIAKHVAAHPGRFMGIATLPMQDPKRGADELKRAMTRLGLKGSMFASNVMGKNLEVDDSIRSYAERKLSKLERRVHDSTRVELELAVEKNPSIPDSQVAEATVHLKGRTLRAREAADDMKTAIDTLADKLVRQVRDGHDKKLSGRKHVDDVELAAPADTEITES